MTSSLQAAVKPMSAYSPGRSTGLGLIQHFAQSDVDGTVVEAKCHDFGHVQEEERHNWKSAGASHICDCPVSSKAH